MNIEVEEDMKEVLEGSGGDVRLLVAMLAGAVADCHRITCGQVGVVPTGGEVVNALSAIQFLQSPWGQKLSAVLTGDAGAKAAQQFASRAASALGVTVKWVSALPVDTLRAATGIYGDAYRTLPNQAKKKLDAPSFRFG